MRYHQWILAAMLGAAMLPGCKKEESTPTPTGETAPAVKNNANGMDHAMPSADEMKKSAGNAAESMKKEAGNAAESVKNGANNAMTGAKQAADNAKQATNGTAATEAQKKLDQVVEYIKENKLDLADKGLKELEENQASLPDVVKNQLPTVRKTLDAAKAGNATGMQMPAMNK